MLECTLLGPELMFHTDALIAVTGAEMTPKIDGIGQHCNVALRIRAGSVLSFHYVKAGARAYLRVAGGIDVPVVLGSRSTTLGAIGHAAGACRRPAADRRPVGTHREGASCRRPCRPLDAGRAARADGLYHYRLTDESARTFFDDEWTVAPEADRITASRTAARCSSGRASSIRRGRRPVEHRRCVLPDRLDPGAGRARADHPHRDAVSGGGYATIGTVISADLDLIGQMQPNHRARFVRVTMADALAARVPAAPRAAACCGTEHRAPGARAGA